jgi:hypothetical protein
VRILWELPQRLPAQCLDRHGGRGGKDHDPEQLPVAGRRSPCENDQEQEESGRPDDDRTMSEGGCERAPEGSSGSIRACVGRSEENQRAVDDEDDCDVSQHARLGRPDHVHRTLVRLRLDERVDDHPAQEASERSEHEADEHQLAPVAPSRSLRRPFARYRLACKLNSRRPVTGTEGVKPVRIRFYKPNSVRRALNEGTSGSARACPRVTGVYETDKLTARFAGISAKPSDGLEPSTPSLPSSNEVGTEGNVGKPRAPKQRKKEESGEDE